ncbi:hypothetical protein [Streptomyces sp. CC224B]|uniref:hypothetical protein n=1 Tax=Streptomyces sp. CC224B TaxID=3044571 RepID=UPI0024A9FB9B|nr:hypothetical protein [Streptomyces sp. CC224B]
MSRAEQYARYQEDARTLAAIGACVETRTGRVTVRLPHPLAEAAVAAWQRDETDEAPGPESRQEYALRDQAAELALIGLALADRGHWDAEKVVVDLDTASAAAAVRASRRPPGTPEPPAREDERAAPSPPDDRHTPDERNPHSPSGT